MPTSKTEPVPPDFVAALAADPVADAAFQAMPPSHRREYVRWIDEAKKTATRTGRIAKAVTMIRTGGKNAAPA